MNFRLLLLSLTMFFYSSLAVASDSKETVSVHMDVYHIVMKQGVEKRSLAKNAKPGDMLEYIATYHNNSDHDVTHLNATLPIPVGMIYKEDSERPRHALASIDGVNYKPMPLTRRVKNADGIWKKVNIPLVEYRFLRWDLKTLKEAKQKKVSARMRVAL